MTYVIDQGSYFFSGSTLSEVRRLDKEKRLGPGCFAVGNELCGGGLGR